MFLAAIGGTPTGVGMMKIACPVMVPSCIGGSTGGISLSIGRRCQHICNLGLPRWQPREQAPVQIPSRFRSKRDRFIRHRALNPPHAVRFIMVHDPWKKEVYL
jgi:hypothetical protein